MRILVLVMRPESGWEMEAGSRIDLLGVMNGRR